MTQHQQKMTPRIRKSLVPKPPSLSHRGEAFKSLAMLFLEPTYFSRHFEAAHFCNFSSGSLEKSERIIFFLDFREERKTKFL